MADKKQEIFAKYGKSNKDTGSPESQVALFSYRIAHLTEHVKNNKKDMVTLYVYEEAFDRLTDEQKNKLMEGGLSNISYDSEKDKLNIDNSRYGEAIRMRRKYPNYVDIIETSIMVIEEIQEEEAQKKEEERERKAAERAARKGGK